MRKLRSKIAGCWLQVKHFFHLSPSIPETQHSRGFTMVELLTVIAIIAILAGLLMPALRKARMKAMEAKAKAMISQLEIALSMYETDFGTYPDYDGGGGAYEEVQWKILELLTGRNGDNQNWDLLTAHVDNNRWNGPYLDVKKDDIEWTGSGNYIKDPWGNPYVVIVDLDGSTTTTYPRHNTLGVDIYSFGPDGMTEGPNNSETSDSTDSSAWSDDMDGNSDDATSADCDKSMDDVNNW